MKKATSKKPPRAAILEKKPDESDYGSSKIMTVAQVAEYLLCHPATLYRLVRRREIPAFRLGGRGDWRFRRSEIEQWIRDRQVKPKKHEYKPKGPRPKSMR
jgi:excisionase family DNA binding protein